MKNKGLSSIVSTLIIIVLAIVAAGVVGIVFRNVISEKSGGVSLDKVVVDVQIKKAKLDETTANITVERGGSDGEVSGLKLILSNGTESKVFDEEIEVGPHETKTVRLFDYGISNVTLVTVCPVLSDSDGKEAVSDICYDLEVGESAPVQIGEEGEGASEVYTSGDLIGYWKFDDNLYDELGLNNGTFVGSESYSEGKDGSAIELTGSNSVNYGGVSEFGFQASEPFSMCTWVQSTTPGNSIVMMKGASGSTRGGYYDFYMTGSYVRFEWHLAWTDSNYAQLNTNLYDGEWHHLCGTRDGAGKGTLYVDGENVASRQGTAAIVGTVDSYPFRIGSRSEDNNLKFRGKVDEAMMFNKELTEAEVQEIYNFF